MTKISLIKIRKILGSKGNPTVEVDVFAGVHVMGRAAAPGGASKGTFEVKDYPKEGIDFGIKRFREKVIPKLFGHDIYDQKGIDSRLHEIDGTEDFSTIGGNIAIATSLAVAKAAATSKNMELYKLLLEKGHVAMPFPIGNVIGGGRHAINGTTMQEFFSISFGGSYSDSAFANVAVHNRTGELLKKRFPGYSIGLGDEKAWVAALDDTEAIGILNEAIGYAAEKSGIEIRPGIDLAASVFYDGSKYDYKNKKLTKAEQIDFLFDISEKFSIKILEDPLDENDFEGFAQLTKRMGKKTIVVGDDLFVTNKKRLEKGIKMKAANAILIKPNQVGTLTDMIDTVMLAKRHKYETIISHRSAETEDSTIAHLAVGLGIRYIKSGAIGGGERRSTTS